MDILYATSTQDINKIRNLFREYEAFLNVDLRFQKFESELASLPGNYAFPSGAIFLARDEKECFGCGAIRMLGPIKNRTCEMKRLYVRPSARGLGIGKQIARRLVQEGVRLGYRTMVLDTLDRLEAAIRLYKSLGFVPAEPYYDNPLSGVMYWELDLIGQQNS